MTFNTKTFHVDWQKNLLILTPQGDSLSYRDLDIQREGLEIKEQITQRGIPYVIVDMGCSNYFSSLMLGVINSIGQSARTNGGGMVLCNASQEMETVLRVMKLDLLWPVVPSLADAHKHVHEKLSS